MKHEDALAVFPPDQYQLLDFGDGRRLERFGPLVLDRPCPTAETVGRASLELWGTADARFERTDGKQGQWRSDGPLPQRWTVRHGPLVFELKRTEFGHLGLFSEQAANWDQLARQLSDSPSPAKVLNLFAYTGGSTLAAAAAGAEVVHVDAARNVVDWARHNAELSGLAEAPVRWIAEDAMKFAKRELKRGNRYDAVILDPPSYGHGPRGEVWRLSKHLPRLLQISAELTAGRRRFVLLTCHTPKYGPQRLAAMLSEAFDNPAPGRVTAAEMTIPSATGGTLPSGVAAWWEYSGR